MLFLEAVKKKPLNNHHKPSCGKWQSKPKYCGRFFLSCPPRKLLRRTHIPLPPSRFWCLCMVVPAKRKLRDSCQHAENGGHRHGPGSLAPKMSLSPTVKHTGQEPRWSCDIFKCWSFLQSKSG